MTSPRPSRRTFFALPLFVAAWPALAAKPAVITLLGDSITAGYGLPGKAALPNQLQAALTRMGVANVVRAAGVSGDTTAGGLGRVDFSVQKDTNLAIVALGGNDLLQGLDNDLNLLHELKQRQQQLQQQHQVTADANRERAPASPRGVGLAGSIQNLSVARGALHPPRSPGQEGPLN